MEPLPSPEPFAPSLEPLLRAGAQAARNGNRGAARTLFLALTREHPQEPRVWLGLAGVAASHEEQRAALERALSLDPGNQHAQTMLQRLSTTEAPNARPTLLLPETVAPAAPTSEAAPPAPVNAPAEAEPPAERAPFPLLNIIATGLILALLLVLGVLLGRSLFAGRSMATLPSATPVLQLQSSAAPAALPSAAPPTPEPVASPFVAPTDEGATPTTLGATVAPTLEAVVAPTSAATSLPAELPLGTVLDQDGWSVTLLRPDYALDLNGALGELQPSGRFVLAVLAVSNASATPRSIPADFFVLTDNLGRRYTPVPGASTAYLALYGRGQRGDLALEDSFDAVSGMRSVPVLFDVPVDAAGLRLGIGGINSAGWPVGAGPAQPGGVGP